MDHAPFDFERLPAELQYEILSLLDWQDILQLRRVSRRSYHSSKDRSVWVGIFRRFASISRSQQINLNKRLELHSASELEGAVLASKGADLVLNSVGPTQRSIFYQDGDSFLTLLDGGRWALAWDEPRAELVYYDLASPSQTPPRAVLLANPSPSIRAGAHTPLHTSAAIEILGGTPYPAFNVASYVSSPGDHPGHVHVWRFLSKFDDDGQVVGFSGELLSSFIPHKYSHRLRLCGSYVTYVEAWDDHYSCTCVVEWARAAGLGTAFPRRYLNGEREDVWPLASNYAICPDLVGRIVNIYDLTQMIETTEHPRSKPTETPPIAWKAELPSSSMKPQIFGPVYTADEILFVTSLLHPKGEDIHNGISIPLERAPGRSINSFQITRASKATRSPSTRTLMAGIIKNPVDATKASLLRYFWDPTVPGEISLVDSQATLRFDALEADRLRRYMDANTLTMVVPCDHRTANILSFPH